MIKGDKVRKVFQRVLTVIIGIILLTFPTFTFPSEKPKIGIGVILGDPTGISVKYWQSSIQAYQFGGAWSLIGEGAVHLHGDFVIHQTQFVQQAPPGLHAYWGIGLRLKITRLFQMGVRIPLGIGYQSPKTPLEFFLEVAPIMELIPATRLSMNGGFGIRYYLLLNGGT